MTKKIIALFTTTRAEFGAFMPLIETIKKSDKLDYLLFVGGAHLLDEYGKTINEIKAQGYKISSEFDYLEGSSSSFDLVNSMGKETRELARIFKDFAFDLTCVAGDRYELVPIALASTLFKRPILHLYGGEITEGVIDEQIRHMLTKVSHLHFTSCDLHTENVKKMGEESWRVFTAGELVVDKMASVEKIPAEKLFGEFKLDPKKATLLLTYHPVTIDKKVSGELQVKNIFEALKYFDVQVIVTAPNVEVGSGEILTLIKSYVEKNSNYRFCESLGFLRYYNFLSHASCVLGNSSSGILEAPFFKIPTVNVGSRQKGRIRHESIIDVAYLVEDIKEGLEKALDPKFVSGLAQMKFKLGDGHAAEKMVGILEKLEINDSILHKKLIFE
jgi:GDP/UDP-N,N'-diacetylbacillosamine 2-epimerase (hydrolysing)